MIGDSCGSVEPFQPIQTAALNVAVEAPGMPGRGLQCEHHSGEYQTLVPHSPSSSTKHRKVISSSRSAKVVRDPVSKEEKKKNTNLTTKVKANRIGSRKSAKHEMIYFKF